MQIERMAAFTQGLGGVLALAPDLNAASRPRFERVPLTQLFVAEPGSAQQGGQAGIRASLGRSPSTRLKATLSPKPLW
jgi:hypothetical protein